MMEMVMGKRRARFWTTLVLSALLSSAALAAEKVPALTLPEAVNRALHTSPEYGAAAEQRHIAQQQLAESRSQYFPSIDFQGQTGIEKTSSPVIAGTENLHASQGSLTLTQLLFDGGGTSNNVQSQRYRLESASHRVRETSELLGLDVVQAYLEILRQRSLLAVARGNLDDHLKIHGKIKAGGDAGTITKGDVAQAEARVNNARTNVAAVEEDLRNAESLFIQKVGQEPEDLAAPVVPRNKLPATVAAAISAALAHNPTLAAYEADIRSAEADYAGTSSAFAPRVNLEVNKFQSVNIQGVPGNQNGFAVQAVMKWNLFRGGGDAERRREFMYRHILAKDRAAFALRQVEKDIRDTWAARDAAEARAAAFGQQSKENEKVVMAYMDQFTLNRRTLLDVLNAENDLFSSRAGHINAFYAADFAVFRLLALEGQMLDILDIAPPQEASRKGLQHERT
jgi:adhesin transport system outer membrane protein